MSVRMLIVLCLVAIVLAGLRISGVTSEAYQAAAHLYVGGLLAIWLYVRNSPFVDQVEESRNCGLLALLLIVVEVGCFIAFKAG